MKLRGGLVGLFSKLFENSKNEMVKKEDSVFFNIVNNLNDNKKTEKISKQLKLLINDEKSTKEDYNLLLNNLNDILKSEIGKENFKNEVLNLEKSYDTIKKNVFDNEAKTFENFLQDFKMLEMDIKVLNEFEILIKNIYQNKSLNQIFSDYKTLYKSYLKQREDSENLILEENEFTKEIEKFSNSVIALEQKYRLSVDWDGKKPAMISYRKKLVEKREELLNKENDLNKKIEVLYITYKFLQDKLAKEEEYIINFLKSEISFFENENFDSEFINDIYIEFEKIINENL